MNDCGCNNHIGVLVKQIGHAIVNEINNDLAQYDVTGVQAHVLIYLSLNQDKKDIFQKDIEAFLKLKNPTVTGIVKRLEEKKLIIRFTSDEDARYKRHILTEKGHEIAKCALKFGYELIEKRLIAGFSKEEQDMLTNLLIRVRDNMEN